MLGLMLVAGGKLTTYRVMAADVVDRVGRGGSGGGGPRARAPTSCRCSARTATPRMWRRPGRPGAAATGLDRRRGAPAGAVRLARASTCSALLGPRPSWRRPLPGAPDYLAAEIAYAAAAEGALHLEDALARRTRISFETDHRGADSATDAAELMGDVLGWDAGQPRPRGRALPGPGRGRAGVAADARRPHRRRGPPRRARRAAAAPAPLAHLIYVDRPAWPGRGRLWSHLVSDVSFAELHAFAELLGAPRRGFDGTTTTCRRSGTQSPVARRPARSPAARSLAHLVRRRPAPPQTPLALASAAVRLRCAGEAAEPVVAQAPVQLPGDVLPGRVLPPSRSAGVWNSRGRLSRLCSTPARPAANAASGTWAYSCRTAARVGAVLVQRAARMARSASVSRPPLRSPGIGSWLAVSRISRATSATRSGGTARLGQHAPRPAARWPPRCPPAAGRRSRRGTRPPAVPRPASAAVARTPR